MKSSTTAQQETALHHVEREDMLIGGYAQAITLRGYRPRAAVAGAGTRGAPLPVIVLFHGGRFNAGGLGDVATAAATLARTVRAWVVAVGYSLAPAFPFPAALEDGYLALQWIAANAAARGVDAGRIGLAGHDAGGNLATCLAAVARDRRDIAIAAQALLAPLLDPSMTCLSEHRGQVDQELDLRAYANSYRAYLPNPMQRLHPYAAPLDSRRLVGLPPTLIASAERDQLHIEAEKYAAALIAAGVPTEMTRHRDTTHETIVGHGPALADVADFFKKRLRKTARPA